MSTRAKHVFLTIFAQAGCLAVGLWMQLQFLESSVAEEAFEVAWAELRSDLQEWQTHSMPHAAVPVSAADVAGALRPGDDATPLVHVTLVDSAWKILDSTFPAGDLHKQAAGAAVGWVQRENPGQSPAGLFLCGQVDFAGAKHLAAAMPLPNQGGYLILHRPQGPVQAAASRLLASVPVLSALTFLWTLALLGVLAYMLLAKFHEETEKERARATADGLRQRQDLVRTRDAVVFGLAKLAESRDPDTGDHLERISVYSTMLASVLRHYPKYNKEITPAFVRLIGISSALHDIGKVGVEDKILLKRGPLTPIERRRMQTHAVIGGQCLREIEQRLGSSNFLQMAREITFAHHERWDGTGYPYGLVGEQIPLSARIVAIADVYDALSSRRVYKQPQPHEECVEIITHAAGTQFDPDLVKIWLTIAPKCAEVARRYSDDASSQPTIEDEGVPQSVAGERRTERRRRLAEVGADA